MLDEYDMYVNKLIIIYVFHGIIFNILFIIKSV